VQRGGLGRELDMRMIEGGGSNSIQDFDEASDKWADINEQWRGIE